VYWQYDVVAAKVVTQIVEQRRCVQVFYWYVTIASEIRSAIGAAPVTATRLEASAAVDTRPALR
jgi:hypothetical protein